jgi:hypothetical protein
MSTRKIGLSALTLCLAAAAFIPQAAAAAAPAWSLSATPLPANYAPGQFSQLVVIATNVGGAPTSAEEAVISATLPAGWEILSQDGFTRGATTQPDCKAVGQLVTCKTIEPRYPGYLIQMKIGLKVPVGAAEETLSAESSVKGGGAGEVSVSTPVAVAKDPLPFQVLPGFRSPVTDEDGEAVTQAGSHPFQMTTSFNFPTRVAGNQLTSSGHPRDFYVDLPRGLVGSTGASEVLCTEVELTTDGCPKESQVGIADPTTLSGGVTLAGVETSLLYNMVPPPGAAAEFAANIANFGLFVHILVGVRTDRDYRVEAATRDLIAFGQVPVFGVQAQIWGTPTDKAHDEARGECGSLGIAPPTPGACSVDEVKTPLLTMPTECPGAPRTPNLFEVLADSWEEPSLLRSATYAGADLDNEPVEVSGCNELSFSEPKIESESTNTTTDSPAGLRFSLHLGQEDIEGHAPATLKDAVVRFPAGLAINPSQAGGLGACTESQIGFLEDDGGDLRFSGASQSCPDSAKIGSVEATTPLLVARNEAHEVEEKEGKPVLPVLHGSLYVAKPFANPLGKLIAVYLVIEDEKTGIVAKLAGEGELNPQTGQITTRFEENPEAPIEDIRVNIFGGDRGTFTTPPTCAEYSTEAQLTPWSAPESPEVSTGAGFKTTQAPGGRPCPTSEGQMPNTPGFNAGALSPAAGKYSPLVLKLSREDGTQRFARFEASLPIGVSAKLAGVGQCSEADIAKARSREVPNQGAAELANPSCPASSFIGIANAAAGSGPTPYYTQGRVYLAGPYKGAPLSAVTIAAAVAGPFDLGTVVIRSAIYLDPNTAQGRVVTDPLPQIIDGIPLDLRSAAVRIERPEFSLNPTSCNEKSFGGSLVSTLGSVAPLTERFQVGGCSALPFKPKLSLRLKGAAHRGAHPSLRAELTAKGGEANIARTVLTLPKSEFIDQAHFRTICTRVQFAANQCPAGSVYGHVTAYTPLLDYPLQGAIYLRSSSQKLPDTVFALRGPPSQPIALDAVGHVDSVKGRLRVTFPEIPDAPLTKVIVSMQGAKKGLFQNSTNICKGTHRATLKMEGQNAKAYDTQPVMKAQCKKGKKPKKSKPGKGGGGR